MAVESKLNDQEIASMLEIAHPWATGFRSDWSWGRASAFTRTGSPQHTRGVSAVRGLYVVGLPWLHTWGSGRFAGIGRDAEFVTERIAELVRVPAAS